MPSRSKPLVNARHGGGALVAVDGDAHDLGAGAVQCCNLRDGLVDIGGVGVGHRLHDDRRAAADDHAADIDADRGAAGEGRGKISGHAGSLLSLERQASTSTHKHTPGPKR